MYSRAYVHSEAARMSVSIETCSRLLVPCPVCLPSRLFLHHALYAWTEVHTHKAYVCLIANLRGAYSLDASAPRGLCTHSVCCAHWWYRDTDCFCPSRHKACQYVRKILGCMYMHKMNQSVADVMRSRVQAGGEEFVYQSCTPMPGPNGWMEGYFK
jgi:hypothetical protein